MEGVRQKAKGVRPLFEGGAEGKAGQVQYCSKLLQQQGKSEQAETLLKELEDVVEQG